MTSFPRLLVRLLVCFGINTATFFGVAKLSALQLSNSVIPILAWSITIILIIATQFVLYRNTSARQKTLLTVVGFGFLAFTFILMVIIYEPDEPIPLLPLGIFEMFFLLVGLSGLLARASAKKGKEALKS